MVHDEIWRLRLRQARHDQGVRLILEEIIVECTTITESRYEDTGWSVVVGAGVTTLLGDLLTSMCSESDGSLTS